MTQSAATAKVLAEIDILQSRLEALHRQLEGLELSTHKTLGRSQESAEVLAGRSISLSKVLEFLMAGTASETGEGFFLSLARHLACAVDVACVHISELIDEDLTRARTLAAWRNGRFDAPAEIALQGTICEVTLERGELFCEQGVQDLFPQDPNLAQLEAVSYCGMCFGDRDGRPLGKICIIDTKPLVDIPRLRTILKLFAARAALELERKRADQALRDSEARLQAVIQHTPYVAIQWFDAAGRVVLWNSASEKMYGFSTEEAVGRSLDQLIFTKEEATAFLEALFQVGQTDHAPYPVEYTFRRRNGETGVCLSSISRIPGDSRDHWFVCMDVDITAQKRAEERVRHRDAELAHALRLATLGEMVAQISHEVNQPLYAIGNYAQASLNELSKPAGGSREEVLEWLRRIHRASTRTSDVLRRIAGFVRREDRKPAPTSLNQLVEGALELLAWKSARQQIELCFQRAEPDIQLQVDVIQVEQVLLNVLLNACEALAGDNIQHGRVTITTHQRAGDIQIDISDNGPGLAAEIRDNLFQAFTTTKPDGLGMGLAISRSIVEANGGTIQVIPNSTQGITVQIVLPSVAPRSTHDD